MRKNTNEVTLIGYLYSKKLEQKTVTRKESKSYGQSYISGRIDIATDKECTNVVPVYYSFVKPLTSKGAENKTYTTLLTLMEKGNTVSEDGADRATVVRANPSLDLNDYCTGEGEHTEMRSLPRCANGFVSILTKPAVFTSEFSADAVFDKFRTVEHEDGTSHIELSGNVFSFSNAIKPMPFCVGSKDGEAYFENATYPLYMNVHGTIVNQAIETTKESSGEMAFGKPKVQMVKSYIHKYSITDAKAPYDYGDPEVMTDEDLKKARADREVYLATVKANHEAWLKTKAATPAPAAATPVVGDSNTFAF